MSDVNRKRKLGRFMVPRRLIQIDWRTMLPVMSHMVVVDARMAFEYDAVEYLAFSDLFEETSDCCETPFYTIVLTRKELSYVVSARLADSRSSAQLEVIDAPPDLCSKE